MALLKLSRHDISKWLEGQKIHKPLQDMTPSEIKRAAETFRIPQQVLLQLINATDFDPAHAKHGADANRMQGELKKQTPNPQRGIYDGEH